MHALPPAPDAPVARLLLTEAKLLLREPMPCSGASCSRWSC